MSKISMLQTTDEEAGEFLNVGLIPNHDRNEENLSFVTVDVARVQATMIGSLVSLQLPRQAITRVIGERHQGEFLEGNHGRGVVVKITNFNLLIQKLKTLQDIQVTGRASHVSELAFAQRSRWTLSGCSR